jgi:hypothetical protein
MAMVVDEGPQLEVVVEPIPTESDGATLSENKVTPSPHAQFTMMNARGDGIWTELVPSVSGTLVPSFTYQVKGVVFTENDIHLDGIFHREDLSYVLALNLLPPEIKSRVKDRLRDEQYEEM